MTAFDSSGSGETAAQGGPDLKQYPCKACGAKLQYKPGTSALQCGACGSETHIPQTEADIQELDFHAYLAKAGAETVTDERRTVKCESCGAETTFSEHETSNKCPFCDSPLVAQAMVKRLIRPQSLLPFKLEKSDASQRFRDWVGKRWFAPNDLKALARASDIDGIYVPYWTYDCNTETFYTGERGIDYYETETYTTTENGETVTKTRQVKRTHWYPVSGVVWNVFDDVLVVGSKTLPTKLAQNLGPWDLKSLAPYADDYLSGFKAESYQVELAEGFEVAKDIMDGTIRQTVRRDIGGDQQRIHAVKTRHDNITFKHILLPIWLSAYRYRDKVYRFLVNGQSGAVQGERPYSALKIALFVVTLLAIIGLLVYFGQAH